MTPNEIAWHTLSIGARYPYDAPDGWSENGGVPPLAADWAVAAARGVIADLSDRRGIKHAFRDIDQHTRADIVNALAEIIRCAGAAKPVTP